MACFTWIDRNHCPFSVFSRVLAHLPTTVLTVDALHDAVSFQVHARQRTAEYHRKLDAERELEMKLRREERQQLRQAWGNEAEPEKKPKKDNDFDLSM